MTKACTNPQQILQEMHDSKSPLQIIASSQLFMCVAFVPQFSCVLSARVDQI